MMNENGVFENPLIGNQPALAVQVSMQLVEVLRALGSEFEGNMWAVINATLPFMRELEAKYPEIMDDNGNWYANWDDIIRELPNR